MAISSMDLTRGKINIDNLLDIVCSAQEEANKPVTLKEAKYNMMGMKIKSDEAYKDDDKETAGCSKSSCRGCPSKCGKTSPKERDEDYNIWDPANKYTSDDEDDDDEYICDYCNRIGYGLKYSPDICDECNECESCGKYAREECDGCSYSIWRDGKRYGDKLSMEDTLSEYDIAIINELSDELREPKYERLTSTGFTVRKK